MDIFKLELTDLLSNPTKTKSLSDNMVDFILFYYAIK